MCLHDFVWFAAKESTRFDVGHFTCNLHSLTNCIWHYKSILRLTGVSVFLPMALPLNKFAHFCYHGRPQKFVQVGATLTFCLFSSCWRRTANGLSQNTSPFLLFYTTKIMPHVTVAITKMRFLAIIARYTVLATLSINLACPYWFFHGERSSYVINRTSVHLT